MGNSSAMEYGKIQLIYLCLSLGRLYSCKKLRKKFNERNLC